jgi:hypothetical protein
MPNLLDSINHSSSPSELSALAANDTYSRAVNAELDLRYRAATSAAALAAAQEDLAGTVTLFSGAVAAARAVAARFPECAKDISDAIRSLQLAMGVVKYNVPAAAAAPGTAPVAPGGLLFGKPAGTQPAAKPLVFKPAAAAPAPAGRGDRSFSDKLNDSLAEGRVSGRS